MSNGTTSSNRLARGAAEFAVIFVGVILALAADRWIAAADERADAAFYLEQLEADLRADSVRLENRINEAAAKASVALAVLREAAGEEFVGTEESGHLAARMKGVSSFSPLDYNRASWDELVSSGRVSLVEDPGLRRGLSAYYDDLEAFAQTELEWDITLRRFEEQLSLVGDPIRHLVLWGAFLETLGVAPPEAPEGNDYSAPGPSPADFAALIDEFRQDPSLQNRLALTRVIWTVAQYAYAIRLDRSIQLLGGLAAGRE